MRMIDITGEKFTRLTAVVRQKDGRWLCNCDCGGTAFVKAAYLRNGNSKSCGCLSRELVAARNSTHGLASHPLYIRYAGMIARCNNPKHIAYANYGGRGIQVCERWKSNFANFLEDMGEPPTSLHTIERERVDGDYEPSNCSWATSGAQARNTRRNVRVVYEGEEYALKDLEAKLGCKRGTLQRRLGYGWSLEEAITRPLRVFTCRAAMESRKF